MVADDDKRDPPIEEPGFLDGVTIVDIGDVRVARGLTRRHYSGCSHRRLIYDNNERRIWCKDCERDVEPFDAFRILVENYDHALKAIERREERLTEVEQFKVRRIATRNMEIAWRHRDMIPACPHCGNGLFPEDFKAEPAMLGKEYALARLGRKSK